MGATRQEVIDTLGWPVSTSSSTTREILNYPEYTVVLENGRVINLQRKPAPARSQPSARPTVTPKQTPQNTRQAVEPRTTSTLPKEREPVAAPAVTNPATPNSFTTHPAVNQSASAPGKQSPAQMRQLGILGTLLEGAAVLMPSAVVVALAGAILLLAKRFKRTGFHRALHRPPVEAPSAWSEALLKQIEWHRFEHLVCALEAESGHVATLTKFGADGGVDVTVTDKVTGQVRRIVQCKAFADQEVGVQRIREFFGVMIHQNAPEGAFYTTSTFTPDARAFAAGKNIHLIDGTEVMLRISRLGAEAQARLLATAAEGDFTTPTCPSCGIKMRYRPGKPGSFRPGFWACTRYPRCRQKLHVPGPANHVPLT